MEKKLFVDLCQSICHNPSMIQNYPESIRGDVLLMREVSKIKGIDCTIMYYVLDDVQDDLEFHLNLLKNGIFHPIDYVSWNSSSDDYSFSLDISQFSNSFIGLSVRKSELFWNLLNEKLKEVDYPVYDVEREVSIAVRELENINYCK